MQFGGFDGFNESALFCCALTPLTAWLPDDVEEWEELELGEAELAAATKLCLAPGESSICVQGKLQSEHYIFHFKSNAFATHKVWIFII